MGRDPLCSNYYRQIGFDVNGGYADKVKVPARNLVRISSTVPDEKAAIIPCAVSASVHAVEDIAKVKTGDRVLVIGVGGIGIHVAQLVLLHGGYTIAIDVDDAKLALAQELGVNETYNINNPSGLPEHLRVDTIIETSGIWREWERLARILEKAGTIVIVGYAEDNLFTLGTIDFIVGEVVVKGSRGSNRDNLAHAVDLVEKGKLQPIVGSVFHLAEASEVLSRLDAGELSGRAVLIPGEAEKGPTATGS